MVIVAFDDSPGVGGEEDIPAGAIDLGCLGTIISDASSETWARDSGKT